METISLRFQEEIIKNMDRCISANNFNSRTEFIREAVREKITALEHESMIEHFLSLRGSLKTHTTDKELRRIREKVGKKILEEYHKSLKPREDA